ncbi:MAG: hypothetical protein E7070_04295 [Bacteroidales bacterium]|jgi:hypothetical protein|nr:hypothetical protein [Bacteroidales bacterium]
MKKTFSLVAVALLSSAAFAEVTDGDYIIQDVATGKYLGGANSWGTQASLLEHGTRFTVTKLSEGVYTLDSHTYNSAANHFFSGTFVDQPSTSIYFTSKGDNYALSTSDGAAFIGSADGNVVDNSSDTETAIQWKFVSLADAVAAFKDATEENPVDATFLIKNASVSRNLYSPKFEAAWLGDPTINGGQTVQSCIEMFGKNFDVYQEISVPNGTYQLTCQGYYRSGSVDAAVAAHAASTEASNAILYANEEGIALVSIFSENKSEADGGYSTSTTEGFIPNSHDNASACFAAGGFANGKVTVVVTNGKLRVGVKKTETIDQDWTAFDNFELYCIGLSSLAEIQDVFAKMVATADSLAALPMAPTVLANLQAATATPEQTAEAYNAAIETLSAAIQDAELSVMKNDNSEGRDVTAIAPAAWTAVQGSDAEKKAYLTGWQTWGGSAFQSGKVIYQSIDGLVPGAAYDVQFYAVANVAWITAATGEGIAQVYANGATYDINVIGQTGCTPASDEYLYEFKNVTVGKDGVLEFGMQNVAEGGNWYVAQVKSIVSAGNTNVASYATTYVGIDAIRAAISTANETISAGTYADVVANYIEQLNALTPVVDRVAFVADSLYAEVAISGKADSLIALLPTVETVDGIVANYKAEVEALEEAAAAIVGKRSNLITYSFDDETSPEMVLDGENADRGNLDYSHTSVVSGTTFLNVWGANNTNGSKVINFTEDLSEYAAWALEFNWAGYSGCNGKAGFTSLVAGETTLFSLTDAAGWGNTFTLAYGSVTDATLAVYPCNKASRISASTGDALNDVAYWYHFAIVGSEGGVRLTITNCNSGETVVKNALISETNVNPTAFNIRPGSCGAVAVDDMTLDIYVAPTIATLYDFSFDDETSPEMALDGENADRGTLDYSHTSVVSETTFLNVWGANNTNGSKIVNFSEDLSSYEFWTLDFDWAGYSGCNGKAGFTSLVAGETTLFTLTDAAGWGNAFALAYGSVTDASLAVYPCNKASRISASTGDALNDVAYWHHFTITGSNDGVLMTITNIGSGEAIVKNVVLSETNVNPTALNLRPGSCGAVAIDQLKLNVATYEEVIQAPVFAVEGQTFTSNLVSLTTKTADAEIYYTTEEGQEPILYTEPIRVFATTAFTAWASKEGKTSPVASRTVTAGVIEKPVAAVVGTFDNNRWVVMSDATEGASIYYGEQLYSGTIVISETLNCGIVAKLKDAYTEEVFVSDTLFVNFEAGYPVQLNQVTFSVTEQSDSIYKVLLNNSNADLIGAPVAAISYELYPSGEKFDYTVGDTLKVATHQRITAVANAEGYATSEPAVMWTREPAKLEFVWADDFKTVSEELIADGGDYGCVLQDPTFTATGAYGTYDMCPVQYYDGYVSNANFGVQSGTSWLERHKSGYVGIYNFNSGPRRFGINNLRKTQVVKLTVQDPAQVAVENDVLELDAANSVGNTLYYNCVKDGAAVLSMTRYYCIWSVEVYNNPDVTPSPNVYIAGKEESGERDVVVVPATFPYEDNAWTYYAVANGVRYDSTLVAEATETTEAVYDVDTVTVFGDFQLFTEPIKVSAPNNTIVAYTEYEGKASEMNYVTIDCDSIFQLSTPVITWVEKTDEGHTFTITDKNLVEAGLYADLNYTYNDETGVLNGETNTLTLAGNGWLTVKAVLPGMDTAYVVSRYVASARESYNETYASIIDGDTLTLSNISGDFESAAGASVVGEYPASKIAVGGTQYVHVNVTDNYTAFAAPFAISIGTNVITNASGEALQLGVDYQILTLHVRTAQNSVSNKDLTQLVNSTNISSAVRAEGVEVMAGVPLMIQSLSEKVGNEIIIQNSASAPVASAFGSTTVPSNGGWRLFANGNYQKAALTSSAYVMNEDGTKFVYTENPTVEGLGVAIIVDPSAVATLGQEIDLVADPAGIETVAEEVESGAIFDVMGRKAQKLQKGQIYISKGAAVIVK